MKNIIPILVLTLLITSCKNEKANTVERDGYYVTGSAPGIYNGVRAYLETTDERGRKTAMDTAIVMNEKFTFEGKVEYPEMLNLSINSVSGSLPLIIENETIDIIIDKDNIFNSKIEGSEATDALITYNKNIREMGARRRELGMTLRTQDPSNMDPSTNADLKELEALNAKMINYAFDFINSHQDNVFSLALLDNQLKNNTEDFNRIEESFSNLEDHLKNSVQGRMLEVKIKNTKSEKEAMGATEIGKVAPAFSAPSPDGKTLSLNDIKGKVTLIDFWASWCRPCRIENPNVVKVYNKYHDKGLEIISVSLDGSRNQKDPKAAWIKAIKEDNLTWHHVSNLNYFNDPVAKSYNIRSIPATFLLDESGKIVAKNLRGPALENAVSKLLD